MTTVIETSEIIRIDGMMIGELASLHLVMMQPEYVIFENDQANSRSNRLFVCDTLDDQSLLIMAMAN